MKNRTKPRPAFTIVELLVAMALIIFIMYILAEAFAAGTTAFRNLKAIGDMNERLRSATGTLRRYLTADHFQGRTRLSDADFWKNGPPQEGFFRIVQSPNLQNPPTFLSINEGNDLDGLPSFSSHTQALHFSVKLRGNNRADFFRASVPNVTNPPNFNFSPVLGLPFADSRFQDNGGGLYCSPAAEVAFFLRATGTLTDDPDSITGNAPQKLYTMYFRQRLLVPDNSLVQASAVPSPAMWPVPYNTFPTFPTGWPNFPQNWKNYLEVSAIQDPANPGQLFFNNLQDVNMPGRRWGMYTVDPLTGLINNSNLPDASSPSTANFISGDGDQPIAQGNPPNMIRPPSPFAPYPRLADDDPNQGGNDVLLTDVLSWHMGVLVDAAAYQQYQTSFAGNQPIGTIPTTGQVTTNPNNVGNVPPVDFIDLGSDILTPYMSSPASMPRMFDTWSSRKDDFYDYSSSIAPMLQFNHPNNLNHPLNKTKIRIRAIKITLRIWDSKTKQTRMTSVVVDL